jgi:hypothetical protein
VVAVSRVMKVRARIVPSPNRVSVSRIIVPRSALFPWKRMVRFFAKRRDLY